MGRAAFCHTRSGDLMSRVVVCGSLNMDVVVQSARRPAAGETLLGAKVSFLPGGKGLNQAVAAARLGMPDGDAGRGRPRSVRQQPARLPGGQRCRQFTGVRVVACPRHRRRADPGRRADNAITVASGANLHFTKEMVHDTPQRDEVWVAQFETPLATTLALLTRARAAGARTVLNLAPYAPHPARLLKCVDVAVLNEIELSQATGARLRPTARCATIVAGLPEVAPWAPVPSWRPWARAARGRGDRRGGPRRSRLQGRVVDTTGAGDCFVGALAARLAGATPVEAARYASAAAACSVERLGAAPSMPTAMSRQESMNPTPRTAN